MLSRLLLLRLLAVAGCVNFSRLIELSQHILNRDDIRSLVVYKQKSYVTDLSEFDMFLRCQSLTVPVMVISDDYTETKSFDGLLGSWSLAFVFMEDTDNLGMFEIMSRTLRKIHSTKIVFVVRNLPENLKHLLRFFETCLRLGIVNVIIFCQHHVLSYEPFPTVRLENLTLAPLDEYFPDRLSDLKGYTFYSPIQQDAERVFIGYDDGDISKVIGVSTEIFRAFVQRQNATFDRLQNVSSPKTFDFTHALALLNEGKMDILLHAYAYFNPELYAWSYPIAQVQWRLLVPYVGEISSFMYLILPFESQVWMWLGGSIFYISTISYITLRYMRQVTECGPVLSRSLLQFLYMPSDLAPCNLRSVVLEMQIIGYGFILTNIYLAFLSAFLTTSVKGAQIDTFEQMVECGVKILTNKFEERLLREADFYRPEYGEIFRVAKADVVNDFRKSLNGSFALVLADDRVDFYLGQQKYLEKKRMHVSKEPLGTHFLTFTMQMDSPFQRNFDINLLQLFQTGLFKKWENNAFDLAVATKHLKIFRSDGEDAFKPLTTLHLSLCWILYAIGISVAVLALLIEVMRQKCRKTSTTY